MTQAEIYNAIYPTPFLYIHGITHKLTKKRKSWQQRCCDGHHGSDHQETCLEAKSIVTKTPKYSACAIENVLNNRHIGKIVVIIDEGETKGFTVC